MQYLQGTDGVLMLNYSVLSLGHPLGLLSSSLFELFYTLALSPNLLQFPGWIASPHLGQSAEAVYLSEEYELLIPNTLSTPFPMT